MADNTRAISRLKHWYDCRGLADYDLQMVSIHDEITLLGHTFKGIDDMYVLTKAGDAPTITAPEEPTVPKLASLILTTLRLFGVL